MLFSIPTNALLLTILTTISAAPTLEKRLDPIDLGSAKSFGGIASSTLTSTGNTVITGSIGTYPGTSITGFAPPETGSYSDTISAGGTAAFNAIAGCQAAYTAARDKVPTAALGSADLGGLNLGPGVYTFPSNGVFLTAGSTLTLNGTLAPTGQFIFLINTTLDLFAASEIVLTDGATPCNVYFIVGSSADVYAGAITQGNILAYVGVAVRAAASGKGTWCALNSAVTLINNDVVAQTTCISS
jgi:hypothetical protein